MNAIDRDFLLKHGFTEDAGNKLLKGLFANHKKFKEVNLSVKLTEPAMLLAHSKEKNVTADINSIQDDRLVLKKGSRCETVIMNILLDEIHNCLVEEYGTGMYDFEFEVRDFRYSLNVSV